MLPAQGDAPDPIDIKALRFGHLASAMFTRPDQRSIMVKDRHGDGEVVTLSGTVAGKLLDVAS